MAWVRFYTREDLDKAKQSPGFDRGIWIAISWEGWQCVQ